MIDTIQSLGAGAGATIEEIVELITRIAAEQETSSVGWGDPAPPPPAQVQRIIVEESDRWPVRQMPQAHVYRHLAVDHLCGRR